jgi:hypothetical protein
MSDNKDSQPLSSFKSQPESPASQGTPTKLIPGRDFSFNPHTFKSPKVKTQHPTQKPAKKLPINLILAVISIVVIIIIGFWWSRRPRLTPVDRIAVPKSALTPTQPPTPIPQTDSEQVTQIVQTFLFHAQNQQTELQMPLIHPHNQSQSTISQLASLNQTINQDYLTTDQPLPTIRPTNVEVSQDQAQVLVPIADLAHSTIRFDLQKDQGIWLIIDVMFNQPLNLKTLVQARGEAEFLFNNSEFYEFATFYDLNAQDELKIFRTLIAETDQRVRFSLQSTDQGYIVALYSPPDIVNHIDFPPGSQFTDINQFEIGDLLENRGILVVYPAGTEILPHKPDITTSPIVQVPLKIK